MQIDGIHHISTMTADGRAALASGSVVVVTLRPDEETAFEVGARGYRRFMQT